MIKTDVLVVGSEGAGARAAIEASDNGCQVLLVTKGRMRKSGATITGVGGIALDSRSAIEVLGMPGDPNDSPDIFFEDILLSGKHINNQRLVEVLVAEAPARIKELADWGMKITDFTQTPGHRYPREVFTSGVGIMNAFKRQVKKRDILVIEDTMVTDLLTRDGQVVGAVGLGLCQGEPVIFNAKAVVLATGGGMRVYAMTTAPEELTGDGQAMGWRAGAELVDMEMVQFHPCNFIAPPAWRGVGFPFTIGPGGGIDTWLLNKWGDRFMKKWDPVRMERTTRDVLSLAIMSEVLEGRGSPAGGVYMSLAHLPRNLIDYVAQWFLPGFISPDWDYGEFNFKELVEQLKQGYAMEVSPASHFFMGGIRSDEDGRTNIPGLYAGGEVAGGVHGANRLSSNAYTQMVVQGARAGLAAAQFAKEASAVEPDPRQVAELKAKLLGPLEKTGGPTPWEIKQEIMKLAWEKAGVIRTGAGLGQVLERVAELKKELPRVSCLPKEKEYNREWVEALQLENLLFLLEAISRSALLRQESRGAHFRKDFPQLDNQKWLCNIVMENKDNEVSLTKVPVVVTRFPFPGDTSE